jgi:ribosomal protein L12E/L44/L45/RPP1/RPP2
VAEGDKLMKEVLNGGYNVHPVPPPNSETKEKKEVKSEKPKANEEDSAKEKTEETKQEGDNNE